MRAPVLVPALATALALAVSGCGSDDASSDPTSSTVAKPAAAAGTTKEVSGTDYRTTVPKRWRDLSGATEGSAIRVDLLYGEGKPGGRFASNLVVTREDPDAIEGKRVSELADQVREQTAAAVGADVPPADEPTKLGGEDAERWILRRKAGENSIVQRQLIAVHGDALYTITLSALADDDDAQELFDMAVAGWRWD